jgi:3-oxoacyl-[acyl-carrier protein] reductase
MVRACAPAMRAAGKGAVVNVSSLAGATGEGSSIAYAASKGALNTMTLSLARALAPTIRVNVVCPGFIATRWFADQLGPERFEAAKRMQVERMPLRRAGTADDVAAAVLFFCGEGSDHITGETLITDAGYHLGLAPLVAR